VREGALCVKECCVKEGALCVKECCVKESGGSGGDGTVRGEGEWLARLVLMCVRCQR